MVLKPNGYSFIVHQLSQQFLATSFTRCWLLGGYLFLYYSTLIQCFSIFLLANPCLILYHVPSTLVPSPAYALFMSVFFHLYIVYIDRLLVCFHVNSSPLLMVCCCWIGVVCINKSYFNHTQSDFSLLSAATQIWSSLLLDEVFYIDFHKSSNKVSRMNVRVNFLKPEIRNVVFLSVPCITDHLKMGNSGVTLTTQLQFDFF